MTQLTNTIPAADYAIVGGSATSNCRLPEDAQVPGVRVVEPELFFETPYGVTTAFKLLEFDAAYTADGQTHRALAVRMHGWRKGFNWATSQGPLQVFWVLKQAGVRKIAGNAGVGGINKMLQGGDIVVADDYLDFTQQRPSSLDERWPNSVSMVEPYCPTGRKILIDRAEREFRRVQHTGIMGCSTGPYIESPAHVAFMRQAGADLVAQSTVPEINFAREIGACYAGIYLVVNPAGYVADPETRQKMYQNYKKAAPGVAKVILNTMLNWRVDEPCACQERTRPIMMPYAEEELS
ncbi:MAG: phosphorylase [Chloroflexi bacterium]|nr:phosphorylase [Chloroflexota bacterium]OJV92768.1 MAG: hypothetical protein BGO39_29840 [Chloroflexi bacterium 54-19]